MNDLISRKDAIDALTKRIENSECGESVDHNKVIADIKSLPSAQQWIPCSERLPMQTGEYIVTLLVGDARWTDKFGYTPTKDGGWYDPENPNQNIINWNKGVIAWMPLPEPWRGE